jgi:hypothetical protein
MERFEEVRTAHVRIRLPEEFQQRMIRPLTGALLEQHRH